MCEFSCPEIACSVNGRLRRLPTKAQELPLKKPKVQVNFERCVLNMLLLVSLMWCCLLHNLAHCVTLYWVQCISAFVVVLLTGLLDDEASGAVASDQTRLT